MSQVIVTRLPVEQLRSAYPLLRQVEPSLTLAQWLRYASRMSRAGGLAARGVLVARRTGALHPSGLVCYRRDRDVRHGAVLTVEHLVALDLLYPESILAALLAHIDELATIFRCSAIRSVVRAGSHAEMVGDLSVCGYRHEAIALIRTLP